jgi:hypothetical protein
MTIMKELLLATATCVAFAGMANACGTTTTDRVCYLRTYDRAHLAQHPNQSVAAIWVSLSPLAQDRYFFDLDVQFRDDYDNWAWITEGGICVRYGPGMNCATFSGGCDVLVETKSNFYLNHKNSKTIYLYPREIELFNGENGRIIRGGDKRILKGGKDDEIFRLDKTVCWKEEK